MNILTNSHNVVNDQGGLEVNALASRQETQPLKLCHFVAIWISKYIAVPKKNEGNPNARGAVERIETDRKQNISPEPMNNADII